MTNVITVLHVLICIFLILVVLLQAGKGGGMGIAFGGAGGAGSVFGGSGAGNFLTRLTVAAAFGFMVTSMSLAYLASNTEVDSLAELSAESRQAAEDRVNAKAAIMEAGAEEGEGEAAGDSEDALEGEPFEVTDPPEAPEASEGAATSDDSAVVSPTEGEAVEAEVPAVAPSGDGAETTESPTDE